MYVLFEDGGEFKTATVVQDNVTSLQVETPFGKRVKIKASNVLLHFDAPLPGQLLESATELANDIQVPFLWECAGDAEFAFGDFAKDYFGQSDRRSTPIEATALLLALHGSPVYFHRKGKGRFRRASADILAAALAGLEKKRRQTLLIDRMSQELQAFRLPEEFIPALEQLLYKPDGNRPETRALNAAALASGLSPLHLLDRCGAILSSHDYHFRGFLRDYFPEGAAFPADGFHPPLLDLPLADEVRAFSIDDAETTEIDDACSIHPTGDGWRIGVHIAAPALGFLPDSTLDAIARKRLSTVYLPGRKITMLPDAAIAAFSLQAGGEFPVLSLYLTVSPDFEIVSSVSRVERIRICANLRHHELEPLFNDATLDNLADFPFCHELAQLWKFASACEARRGKSSSIQGINDYHFSVEGNPDDDPDQCRIRIVSRQRGSPIDKLVSELMIAANSLWGGLLAEKGIPAIYRAQTDGKVRMTASPLPHEGLGVKQYAWSSSPLRRYVDLVNQRQLIACLANQPPPFAAKSNALFAVMRDFDLAYNAYAEFQRQMERYWCLRWLLQDNIVSIEGVVLRRENLVRIERLPLVVRVASLTGVVPGDRVRLSVESIDLLTLQLDCRYLESLEPRQDSRTLSGEIPAAQTGDLMPGDLEAQ